MKNISTGRTFRELWYNYRSEFFFLVVLLACVTLGHWLSYYVPVDFYEHVILPIQHGANTTLCLLGAWLLLRHSEGMRTRKVFGLVMLIWGIADGFFISQTYVLGVPVLFLGAESLTAYELLAANVLAWLLLVYPTEVLRPGWLNAGNVVLQLLPMMALVALDYVVPADLRMLILAYPAVLLVLLFAHLRAYRLWCEDNYSSMEKIDAQWIVRYLVMVFVIGASYLYICISKNPSRTLMQNTLLFFMFVYSLDQILFRSDPEFVTQEPEDEKPLSENAAYREQLEQWMANDKPYLNPEFRLMDLRTVLPLNRTYLSQMIHSEYDCTFYEFVNRYRVEEAQRIMRENPDMKMVDVSDRAGFSSPTYFIRIFTSMTGQTPREWSKKILSE